MSAERELSSRLHAPRRLPTASKNAGWPNRFLLRERSHLEQLGLGAAAVLAILISIADLSGLLVNELPARVTTITLLLVSLLTLELAVSLASMNASVSELRLELRQNFASYVFALKKHLHANVSTWRGCSLMSPER